MAVVGKLPVRAISADGDGKGGGVGITGDGTEKYGIICRLLPVLLSVNVRFRFNRQYTPPRKTSAARMRLSAHALRLNIATFHAGNVIIKTSAPAACGNGKPASKGHVGHSTLTDIVNFMLTAIGRDVRKLSVEVLRIKPVRNREAIACMWDERVINLGG